MGKNANLIATWRDIYDMVGWKLNTLFDDSHIDLPYNHCPIRSELDVTGWLGYNKSYAPNLCVAYDKIYIYNCPFRIYMAVNTVVNLNVEFIKIFVTWDSGNSWTLWAGATIKPFKGYSYFDFSLPVNAGVLTATHYMILIGESNLKHYWTCDGKTITHGYTLTHWIPFNTIFIGHLISYGVDVG